ncbi:MAG: amidohydrolase [Steroidobacteraceae bacterium]
MQNESVSVSVPVPVSAPVRQWLTAAAAAVVPVLLLLLPSQPARAADALAERVDAALAREEPRVLAWRRDFHQNPELSNREFRTSKIVEQHLRKLGLAVETGVAKTGVVGVLQGGRPGATLLLRADMDALPVTEQVDVPFRSRATSTYRGEAVGVMHACGHDSHTAILMGVAEALTAVKADLPGRVVFLFQPAEEGAPAGEEGGAELALKEGLLQRYAPGAAFALHVQSMFHTGRLHYRSGPIMAASDSWRAVVKGRQTHGGRPWNGVDPIVVSAQIVTALQTIVSRQVDLAQNPAVVTVGVIKGGIRNNIIPDDVEMIGTIRSFDLEQRADIIARMRRTIEQTAAAGGASATFEVDSGGNPVNANDAALTAEMLPVLRRVAGEDNVRPMPLQTGAEDFAFIAQKVPSFYFFVGVTPADRDLVTTPQNHSPLFYLDESALPLAGRAMAQSAVAWLEARAGKP